MFAWSCMLLLVDAKIFALLSKTKIFRFFPPGWRKWPPLPHFWPNQATTYHRTTIERLRWNPSIVPSWMVTSGFRWLQPRFHVSTTCKVYRFQTKLLHPTWSFPMSSINYQTQESISDLTDQFADLALDKRSLKRPPSSYMCHLCFQKGHYIKDCPKVSREKFLSVISARNQFVWSVVERCSSAIFRAAIAI